MKLKTEDVLLYGGIAFLAYQFLKPKAVSPLMQTTHTLPTYAPVVQTQQPGTAATIVSSLATLAPAVIDLLKPKQPAVNPVQSTMPVNIYETVDTPTVPQDYPDIYSVQTYDQDPSPMQSFFQNGGYKNYGANLAGIGSVTDERAGYFGWY